MRKLTYISAFLLDFGSKLIVCRRQFGNILVLSATYKSKSSVLSSLVPREKLEHLFERTISFLRSLMPLSESLERDARILEALRELVFETRPVGSSFSSMDS